MNKKHGISTKQDTNKSLSVMRISIIMALGAISGNVFADSTALGGNNHLGEVGTNNSVAVGYNNKLDGNHVYVDGTQNSVYGVRVGIQGSFNTVSRPTSGVTSSNGTITNQSYYDDISILGNRNTVNSSGAYIIGSHNTVTANNIFSIGSNNQITASNTYTLGSNINTNTTNSVYLGDYSAVENASKSLANISNGTVSSITYGNFSGATAKGVITVGAKDKERRIVNVAAGELSEHSTDAINGSQLYMVVKGLTTTENLYATNTTGLVHVGTLNADGNVTNVNSSISPTFVNATTVATAINQSGFTLTTSGNKIPGSGKDELINPGDTVNMVAGKNLTIKQEANGTITYATADKVSFTNVTIGDVSLTDNGSGSLNIANTNTGNATKITGVANGTISANSIEAVNGSQLYALQNNVNNINTLIGGSNSNSTVTDTNGNAATNKNGNATTANEALTTYDAYGTGTASNLTVITAVQNINEQGTKYIHVNGGESSYAGDRGNNVEQSQANGGKSTAIGYKTIANGSSSVSIGNQAQTTADNAVSIGNMTNASTQSVAIGDNAAATGTQAIAIGTGNIVSGSHSGAFGDPNNVTANYAYVVGNNNTVTTENTFILGNNVSVVEENSVALGANTSITAGDSVGTAAKKTDGTAGNTTTAGTTGVVNNTTVNGVSYGGFAGSAAIGAVSVGASGVERRIQNVAAGEISPTSTDAINGSQLYQVASNIGDIHNRIDDLEDNTNAGIAGAIAQGSIPQVTRPGATGIGVGGGYFGGQNALAVGFSALTDSGNWVIKGTISGNTQGKLGVGAGALYQW